MTVPVRSTMTHVLPPRAGKAEFLVVLLHGYGADAASFLPVAEALRPSLPNAEFVAPDGFDPFEAGIPGRQWFSLKGINADVRPERVRQAGEDVSRWIDAELDRRSLGRQKLIVIGFSQGAIVGAWLALHRKPEPTAVVMLSGRVAEPAAGSERTTTPVFVAHGELDSVIPVSEVVPGVRLLESRGARVTVRRYPALDHHVSPEEIQDVATFIRAVAGLP